MSLKAALNRSDQLQNELLVLFSLELDELSQRYQGSRIVCSVAIEHAEALRQLLRNKLPTSAISLLRIQFETFVRAVWLLHAASEAHVISIMDTGAILDEKRANTLPMLSQMIAELEGNAPDPAVLMIKEFKAASWKYLSSHVHGGYYALQLHGIGVPPKHSAEVLKMSNGLLTLTGIVLCTLCSSENGLDVLRGIKSKYRDCLPELNE